MLDDTEKRNDSGFWQKFQMTFCPLNIKYPGTVHLAQWEMTTVARVGVKEAYSLGGMEIEHII